jgi:hypothetical protein
MFSEFSHLTISERELVFKAPLLVCILIAGADGKIDSKEVSEAIGIARDRDWVKANLNNYYREVSQDFEDKIKVLIQSYPHEPGPRNEVISRELNALPPLWKKLGNDFSSALYASLRYVAQRIAMSSGGFLRKISPEEASLIDLPMISEPPK